MAPLSRRTFPIKTNRVFLSFFFSLLSCQHIFRGAFSVAVGSQQTNYRRRYTSVQCTRSAFQSQCFGQISERCDLSGLMENSLYVDT